MTDVSLGIPQMPAPDYPADVRARLESDAREVIARYPGSRSALLPLLHLVQSEEGHVTRTGIRFCAEMLGLTTAEVTAVSTFYTMYRRKPSGDYQVGVCTNTLCAVMGVTPSSTSSSSTSASATTRRPRTARSPSNTSSATRPATSPRW